MANSDDDALCTCTHEGEEVFNRLHSAIADDNSEQNVHRQIKGTDLEYIGQGDMRVVLLDKKGDFLNTGNACVVKINKYGDNEANQTEVQNWQRVEGPPKKHLMRITDWDDNYRWVVMPYVSTNVDDEMLIELEKTFTRNGYKINDVNKRNTARVQDRAVMIDYDKYIKDIDLDVMDMDERMRLIDWKYE